MTKDMKRMDVLSMFRAADELQPQEAQQVLSDYDMGTKAAYSVNWTAEKLDQIIKPLRKAEKVYQVKLQDLQSKLKEEKKETKRKALKKEIQEHKDTFRKDQEELLEEVEKDVRIRQVDLSEVSSKCRVPAWWVWDDLRDLWTCEEAEDATYSISIGDALEVRRAVSIYLFAPPLWMLHQQKKEGEEVDPEKRFPVNIGWGFASKLFWNAESIRRALEPYSDELEAKKKLLPDPSEKHPKKSDKEPKEPRQTITQEELEAWIDQKLEETIEVKGLRSIKLDEFPEDLGTPVGAVMKGLMPIIESD